MPKEYRAASHHYRPVPAPMPTEQSLPSTTRVTSIWTAEEDETLMTARAQGLSWQPIANLHFPAKTANACRKRHERLMERRNNEDWDGVKLEELAVAYMAVRKEMWTILANQLDEKWQTLESKCMEKGIKNLTAAVKSATRKRRGMDSFLPGHQHHYEYHHDSGFGGSDTDAEFELETGPQYPISSSGGPSHNSGYIASTRATSSRYTLGGGELANLQFASGALRPMDEMMLRTRAMDPMEQGRNMSVQAMLSPSPPSH